MIRLHFCPLDKDCRNAGGAAWRIHVGLLSRYMFDVALRDRDKFVITGKNWQPGDKYETSWFSYSDLKKDAK